MEESSVPSQESIRAMLSGEDRRSTGRSDEVVRLVTVDFRQVESLLECLWDEDPRIVMRAADAAEKISRTHAFLLQESKNSLLGLLAEAKQQELRWHLALTMPRLELSRSERQKVLEILQTYLEDRSSIVKTFALQGLWDLTKQDPSLGPMIVDLLQSHSRNGTPAMRARCRILLKDASASCFTHKLG